MRLKLLESAPDINKKVLAELDVEMVPSVGDTIILALPIDSSTIDKKFCYFKVMGVMYNFMGKHCVSILVEPEGENHE